MTVSIHVVFLGECTLCLIWDALWGDCDFRYFNDDLGMWCCKKKGD